MRLLLVLLTFSYSICVPAQNKKPIYQLQVKELQDIIKRTNSNKTIVLKRLKKVYDQLDIITLVYRLNGKMIQEQDSIDKRKVVFLDLFTYGEKGVYLMDFYYKPNVDSVHIDLTSNKKYYYYTTNGKDMEVPKTIWDTITATKKILDLSPYEQSNYFFKNFDNTIQISGLGISWDRATISVNGANITGQMGTYILRAANNSNKVKIVFRQYLDKSQQYEKTLEFDVMDLPSKVIIETGK